MTKALNNYDKTKISMAHVFLQYDQATMIHKYSLDYNSDWLYITFINRTYRINRKTGSVQWSDNDFETVHEANKKTSNRIGSIKLLNSISSPSYINFLTYYQEEIYPCLNYILIRSCCRNTFLFQ